MNKINFIGIGAQKCASTWIFDILQDHPDVTLSTVKEINYFSYYYGLGYDWYQNQFVNSNAKIVGEISPSYFNDVNVPARVFEYNPDIKIVLTLRNPVERAISQHKHNVRLENVGKVDLSFEYGMENNPTYLERGLYAKYLKKWLEYFDESQIHVVFFDDVKKDSLQVAKSLYSFLEIDTEFESAALNKRSNESFIIKNKKLDKIIKYLKGFLEKIGLKKIWFLLEKTGVKSLYRKVNRMQSEERIPAIKPGTQDYINKYFIEDILELEKLTNRDLSSWQRSNS